MWSELRFFSSLQCWRKPITKSHAPELKIKFHWLGIMHLLYIFFHRNECFTEKYCKNYSGDLDWFIFHNFTQEFADDVISVISFWNLNFLSLMSFCLYNKKNITQQLEDMNFIFLCQKQYFTHSLHLFEKN